jgi:hypothetical protein
MAAVGVVADAANGVVSVNARRGGERAIGRQ